MPITKTFNNTSYSIPLEGELNWSTLSNFLVALADNAQTTNKQKIGTRVATASPVTVLATTDCLIITDLAVAGAVAVNLPAGVTSQVFTIVDGKGDAGTNNITITPAAGTINGAATYVIDSNRAGVTLVYNGTEWTVTAEFISAGDIPRNQIASGSANHVVINDGSGDLSSEATLATSRGGFGEDVSAYNGVVKAVTGNFESGSVVNNDIDAAAAIARTKLANGTADHVIINNGTGVMSSEAQLALSRGGTGINASSTTDLFNQIDPLTAQGDILKRGATNSEALAIGASGTFLKSNGTDPAWAAVNLDDLNNVTVPTPEDGQALVYDSGSSAWVSGASGDSSFKLQGVTDPSVTIKGGYLLLDDGREIATYDGAGTAATDFGTDIVVNLDTVLGSNPTDATTYYLYLNLLALGSEVTIDNGRKVYSIAAADTSKFYLSTTKPEAINRAQYAVIGFVRSATTGTVWSGSGAAFGTVASKKHDNGAVAVNPVVYTLPKQAVGSVGASGQVVAGHVLDINSFRSGITTGQLSFYNLAANPNDGYGGRTLTANGSLVYTSANVIGAANSAATLDGTNDSFSLLGTFFDFGDADFCVGGWVSSTDWTPANYKALFTVDGGAADAGWGLWIYGGSTGDIVLYYPITGSTQGTIVISNPGFVDGSLHHFVVKYEATPNKWSLYIDGTLVGTAIQANRDITNASPKFTIGQDYAATAAYFLAGSVQQFFGSTIAFSDEEIRKLYAAKISHAANVATVNQEWTANVYSKVATQDDQSWLVDKTSKDNLFVDFSGLASTDSVELFCKNTGLTPVIVSPVPPFDQTYTSAPTFPITHGQPVVPQVQIMQEIASGSWETITAEGLVAANSTTLTGTVAALFTNGATKVRIIAKSPQNDATGVTQASGGNYGLVSYREDDTSMASVTFAGNLGGSQSSAIAIKITKIGRMVTLTIPQLVTIVPTGNSITLVTATALPTWARPLTTVSLPFIPADNGTYTANAIGQMDIQTSGIIRAYKNATGTAPWTNSANAGWVGAFSVSYPV